jgi:adenylate cyclase class IV
MDKNPQIFYEIELKSVFDKAKYDQLNDFLNSNEKFKLLNKESITTEFYKADADQTDVRLRNSDKTIELICKKGLVTKICRKEIQIPLASMEKLEHLKQVFDFLPLEKQPKTLKHKQEFMYKYKGFDYCICLQHIEDFAYLLEVEYLADKDESELHEPNLLAILKELGLELISGEKFLKRVEDYKAGKVTIDYPV